MHREGREGGANYLQVVTKDTLEDQVGLSISIARLAPRGGIQLASLKELFFLFQMQLSAKCLVIFLLTINILGVLRRQRIPLPTDPHTGTGVISGIGIGRSGTRGIGSSNCSKSNNSSSSSNGGRPELAQSYTNLRLTQDNGMEGTMKNLTFLARYGGCAIAKKACVTGVCRFGRGVQPRHLTLPSRGSPPLQSGGQNQKWPTSGQSGYLTPAVLGIPTAYERGAKSEVAHKWAKWLPHPCRLGDPHRFRAGGKIRSGPQVGKVATSPLPYWGSPPLTSGGQNQKWPTSGQNGYLTPAVSGIPTASERGAKSEVAHKWAKWLPHPCRIGDPHRLRAGGKIRSGPQVGKMATSPLLSRGSPPLQSGGQNQKWPTSGQSGYLTPAVLGIPTASERGAKSEVAHKWAKWLPHPCRIGDPHRLRAGGKIRSGPQVGKMATSPLLSRGSPPLQSGGQNQKWPTNGQNGYLTPAVWGIPTAPERGAKSEVANKWAKWLPHPCRIGDPHRFRAGGKIRGGPQVGKVAFFY